MELDICIVVVLASAQIQRLDKRERVKNRDRGSDRKKNEARAATARDEFANNSKRGLSKETSSPTTPAGGGYRKRLARARSRNKLDNFSAVDIFATMFIQEFRRLIHPSLRLDSD